MAITDTDRLNFLERKGAGVGRWIARDSIRGLGVRLYSGSSRGYAQPTVRDAIDQAMLADQIFVPGQTDDLNAGDK